ncbi:hypothetical protein C0J52_13292 [Blattella germanica]|nr:hypothetical protein C0J52_13292 [Blattella germanica]
MEEIYVVKVRTEPDPSRLYPSERRYSALTVGGLGAVHLLLGATSLLLGCLGLALQSDACWTGRYGGGLWLGIAAVTAGAAGILAWRRWYVDNNIRWFFISSTVAATTSLLCLIITAAALAAIQEQKSTQEFYRSIYYDQGIVHETPVEDNTFVELPSLSLHRLDDFHSSPPKSSIQNEEFHSSPPFLRPSDIEDEEIAKHEEKEPLSHSITSEENQESKSLQYNQSSTEEDTDKMVLFEESNSKQQNISDDRSQSNSKDGALDDVSLDDFDDDDLMDTHIVKVDTPGTVKILFDVKTEVKNKTNGESSHIMKIEKGNKSGNKTIDPALLSTLREQLDNAQKELSYNRPKKSTQTYQNESDTYNTEEHSSIITIENNLKPSEDSDRQEVTSPINDESQDMQTVPVRIQNDDFYNHSVPQAPSPKQSFHQDPPHFEKLPRTGREVRTVVAINILVASALELAWSLLSASIAWKGMKNSYPHENGSSNCERTVEGLERSAPPASSTGENYKRHKITDVFRKPDIISNHRHCHLAGVQNKNGINRLMINTVSERINIEPYLPMEESTMEYQERVHRFLASNNAAATTSDSVSNVES